MIINFVANYQNGYVGEQADEVHLARELEKMGNIVRRIPRDVWREWVLGNYKERPKEVPEDLKANINLVAKWHHFYDGRFIDELRKESQAPVFLWVWDFMYSGGFPDWHISMAKAADLYLSGEAGIFDEYKKLGIKPYYFQMDVCDGDISTFSGIEKIHDVVFTGSYLEQGHRKEWLPIINKKIPIKIWAWNWQEWKKLGIESYPAVYGEEYNRLIEKSRIILGFSVEPNCWGYWSNRVGKVLRGGGFLLQEYAPGMETQLPTCIKFFNSPQEAIDKIEFYLSNPKKIEKYRKEAEKIGYRFTSKTKMGELDKLMNRFLRGDPLKWDKLPQ